MGFCGNDARISALADAAELWGNILSSTAWDNPRDNYGVYSFQTDAENFEFRQLKHKTSMNVNGGGTYFDGRHYWINWESYGMGNWYADDYTDDWRNVDGNFSLTTRLCHGILPTIRRTVSYTVFLMRDQRFRLLTLPQCRQLRSQPYIPVSRLWR